MRVLVNEGDKVEVREYPQDPLLRIPKTLSSKNYLETYGAFDIETTNIQIGEDIHAIMYLWQFCIGNAGRRDVYVGRSWKDFRVFMNHLKLMYNLDTGKKMVIWVHNLPFEFQFLRSILEPTKMFAVKKRVPVVVTFDDVFEFRCSYRLSNMSLSKFAEQERAPHQKQSDFDYLKLRYPDTQIDDNDLYYGVCDVLSLHESVESIMAAYGDTLTSMPFTSTGYPRREARERVQSNYKNHYDMLDRQLSPHLYKLCKSATRGGNTHTNALFAGEIIRGSDGYDISSSYPTEMVAGDGFPRGPFREESAERIIPDACNLLFIRMEDVRIKPGVYFPYIAYSKCERLQACDFRKARFDNGRVLYAPLLVMTVTEIDFEIILRQYDIGKLEIVEQYVADRGYLYPEYREYVMECYKAKCELKSKDPYFYAKYKNRVNALFGMMLTDITREEISYAAGQWESNLPPVAKCLMDYYKNYRSFLSYQDGLYVTAGARAKLQRGLDLVGIDAIYCDTDSIKYRRDHTADFELLNKEVRERNARAGVKPVVVNGETFELGIWEHDCNYSELICQGAKKYAYVYSRDPVNGKHAGQMGVTVAGLSKKLGARYLEENGGLEAFKTGAIWDTSRSGRLRAIYNDTIQLVEMEHNGHPIELTSNVALIPTSYELGYSKDYKELLEIRDKKIQESDYRDLIELRDLTY